MKIKKDPKVKLTLTVKKSVIEEAKKYALAEGASLSNIVEDYFAKYAKTSDHKQEKTVNLADELFGCAKDGPLSNMTDDEIKALYVKDRFGL